MHYLNTGARASTHRPYTAADYEDVAAFYARHPQLRPTPLRALPAFARAVGVGELHVKDESSRFGLNAFKSLGVRYAIDRLQRDPAASAKHQHVGPGATLVCASAGNHGRAVARAARELGLAARVYMAAASAEGPRRAIASEGAEVVLVDGGYEDAVRRAAADAESHGWTIISDTSWPGYEEIPRLIMLGYTRLISEVEEQLQSLPDVVFAQAGVGGLLCGVAAGVVHEWAARRPSVVSCEPTDAACLLASAQAGRLTSLEGPPATMMAGLACAEPSPAAWGVVRELVDAFVAIDDGQAMAAMRMLARPLGSDPKIEAGPSGACGFAALVAVMREPSLRTVRDALGLGASSRVVVINSEGATDRELYERVIA
jgi:diaminopropionate ammonia-lyase